MSLEDILRKVKALGYQGIEIVAAQMVPGYPYPTDEWLDAFGALLKKYDLTPVCWSAYVDLGIQKDRALSEAEIEQFTLNDLLYAKRLGFELVRTQHMITPEILRRFIPVCKQLNIKLAIEMHYPHHPEVPVWRDEYLPLMRGEGRGVLGVVPDCSIFQYTPHKLFVDDLLRDGFRPAALDRVIALHKQGAPLQEACADCTPEEQAMVGRIYDRFAHPAAIAQIPALMDVAFYVHGKFYYLDGKQDDPCIPYTEIFPAIAKTGFTGFIACEYEGHHFTDKLDTAEQLKRYVEMNRRILPL